MDEALGIADYGKGLEHEGEFGRQICRPLDQSRSIMNLNSINEVQLNFSRPKSLLHRGENPDLKYHDMNNGGTNDPPVIYPESTVNKVATS